MSITLLSIYDDIHFHYTTSGPSRRSLMDLIRSISGIVSAHYPGLDQLETLHQHCLASNVNDLRLSIFRHLNQNYNWRRVITDSIGPILAQHLGPDIYIQKNINISVQLPADPTSILPMHSDCMSGDSPFQLNIWIPVTRAYGSNSMFLIDRDTSLRLICQQLDLFSETSSISKELMDKVIYDSNNIIHTKKYYVDAQPGDFLIFNPAVLHGNELNTTSITRASLNVRITNIGAPSPLANNSDRSFHNYFDPLVLSTSHTFAASLYHVLATRVRP